MASITVTVYKINGQYFPDGCERKISCSGVKSLNQNVTIEMASPVPLTCDDDLPGNKVTEVLQMPNGDKWWIEQTNPSFFEKCALAVATCCTSIEDIGEATEPDISLANTIQVNNDGQIWYVDNNGQYVEFASGGPSEEIDVFLIAGQSNARGVGTRTLSPNPSANTVYQYYQGTFSQVTDEVGLDPVTESNRGSAWPSFGITWNKATGRKICFVPTGVDGTGLLAASDTGFGNWSPSGTLYSNSVTQLGNAITAIQSAGMTPVLRGVLWHQGENDGNKVNDGTITGTDYQNALVTLIANYRTAFGANLPFYIFRIGTRTTASDTGFLAIRQAQVNVANNDSLLTRVVFYNAISYQARSLMSDQYHYTQAGYNEMGQVGAENILNVGSYMWQRQGENKLFYSKGNVGIGIENPSALLHVSGGVPFFDIDTNGGAGSLRLTNINAGANAASGHRIYTNNGLQAQIVVGSSAYSLGGNVFIVHAISGNMRVGSNGADIELYTGAGGPSGGNTKLRILNNGGVGIGSNVTPVASALVEMQSTAKGFLPPRMTATQAEAISSPAEGLMVYATDGSGAIITTKGWWGYDGATWVKLN